MKQRGRLGIGVLTAILALILSDEKGTARVAPSAPPPVPVIDRLAPNPIEAGQDQRLMVDGSGFVSGDTSVTINGFTSPEVEFVNSQLVVALVPALAVPSAGTATLTVNTPGGMAQRQVPVHDVPAILDEVASLCIRSIEEVLFAGMDEIALAQGSELEILHQSRMIRKWVSAILRDMEKRCEKQLKELEKNLDQDADPFLDRVKEEADLARLEIRLAEHRRVKFKTDSPDEDDLDGYILRSCGLFLVPNPEETLVAEQLDGGPEDVLQLMYQTFQMRRTCNPHHSANPPPLVVIRDVASGLPFFKSSFSSAINLIIPGDNSTEALSQVWLWTKQVILEEKIAFSLQAVANNIPGASGVPKSACVVFPATAVDECGCRDSATVEVCIALGDLGPEDIGPTQDFGFGGVQAVKCTPIVRIDRDSYSLQGNILGSLNDAIAVSGTIDTEAPCTVASAGATIRFNPLFRNTDTGELVSMQGADIFGEVQVSSAGESLAQFHAFFEFQLEQVHGGIQTFINQQAQQGVLLQLVSVDFTIRVTAIDTCGCWGDDSVRGINPQF